MNAPLAGVGRIVVTLGPDGAVALDPRTVPDVAALLCGKRAADALELLPRIYSVCALAHVAAARRALREGLTAEDADGDRDHLPVLAERAREHLLRILIGWRLDGAAAPPAKPVMALVASALDGVDGATLADDLSGYLETGILGCPPEEFAALSTVAGFGGWLMKARTGPAGHLRALVAAGWADIGVVDPAPLPPRADIALYPEARASDAGALDARSSDARGSDDCSLWETGPLARRLDHPLIAALTARHGAGLLARLAARLIDLAELPAAMRAGPEPASTPPGLGVVETARGRLIHSARLRDGRIDAYRIVAPTDWNFRRDGVAARALSGLPDGPAAERKRKARAVLEAIDPCVDIELRAC